MIMRLCRLACVLTLCSASVTLAHPGHHRPRKAQEQTSAERNDIARGTVFEDANENGKLDEGEKPLPKVRVSNGQQIVLTDNNGRYELPVSDDTMIFVIKPRGWRTPLSEHNLPRFYYIHKPNGSPAEFQYPGVAPTGPLPEAIDFPLYAQQEPEKFRAIFFGDPQPRDEKEVEYIAHDVVEELIGVEASFGVTLGDIAFDNLDTFEPLNRTIAMIGIPWYNVIGNHDINYDAKNDKQSDETFERVYGPNYYSFDYGSVHFLVLDDIEWHFPEPGGKGKYRGGLGQEQMEFIRNDLALIPEDQLVVLMMHIPLVDVRDRQELYRLIEKRPFCMSISGHTHHHEHRYITREDGWMGPEPHHHIINVTVCGSWWSGAPDDRGIPHTMMADGAPNGYSMITFDGTSYELDFKAAGRSKDYQMNIQAPEKVSLSQIAETTIYANIFNGSERSKVEIRLASDQEWAPMERTVQEDPLFKTISEHDNTIAGKTWRNLPKPKRCPHLWQAALPGELSPGTYLIEIRETDPKGRIVSGHRVIHLVE